MQQIPDSALKSPASGHRLRPILFGAAWRLAIFLLPWQTRWLHGASLAGWPWEQGSWAVYASWLLLLATIVLGYKKIEIKIRDKHFWMPVSFGLLVFAANLIFSSSITATLQWWIQVALLGMFVWTLWRAKVRARSVACMFVASLIPQAVLAYWQFAVQRANAIKWLGMAFHSPKELGTAVVEFGLFRYLRAYGGMPHPNILGAWLALGIPAAVHAGWSSAKKSVALFYATASAVISGALVLTFSRTSYAAAAVGVGALCYVMVRRRKTGQYNLQFGMLAVVCCLLFALVVAVSQREVVMARTQEQNRLEAKSLDARSQSLKEGWQIFLRHPILGSGPNAELVDVWSLRRDQNTKLQRSPEPLESPHNAFLLMLADFGLLGSVLMAYLIWRARKCLLRVWPAILPLVILAWFDHYLLSYWSGQALLAVVILTLCVTDDAAAAPARPAS